MTPSEFNDAWRAQLAQYRRGCRLNAAPAPVQRQDGAGVGPGERLRRDLLWRAWRAFLGRSNQSRHGVASCAHPSRRGRLWPEGGCRFPVLHAPRPDGRVLSVPGARHPPRLRGRDHRKGCQVASMSEWVLIMWFLVRDGRALTAIDVASQAQCEALYADAVAAIKAANTWTRGPDGYVCVRRRQ